METRTYRITGMTCGGCVKHVEKALRSVPGVTGVTVDLAKGTAAIEGAPSLADMTASVASAGYELVGPA
jgi:copper chaperone